MSDDATPEPGQPPAILLYLLYAFFVIVLITVLAVVGAYA
jgi:hypothetical protein